MFTRYAIYYTPEPGTALADFGASWLGWDSARGATRAQPAIDGLDVGQITAKPRKYGFHGTIKPPFRLAEGATAQGLSDAIAQLCETSAPVALQGLRLSRLGRFLALVPEGDSPELSALAARAVRELDVYRAPSGAQDIAKRRAGRLNAAQDANLLTWGYPYVLDQFRFHMTLTSPMDVDAATQTEAALSHALQDLDLAPYHMTGLTLMGEDEAGKFHQIHRYALIA